MYSQALTMTSVHLVMNARRSVSSACTDRISRIAPWSLIQSMACNVLGVDRYPGYDPPAKTAPGGVRVPWVAL